MDSLDATEVDGCTLFTTLGDTLAWVIGEMERDEDTTCARCRVLIGRVSAWPPGCTSYTTSSYGSVTPPTVQQRLHRPQNAPTRHTARTTRVEFKCHHGTVNTVVKVRKRRRTYLKGPHICCPCARMYVCVAPGCYADRAATDAKLPKELLVAYQNLDDAHTAATHLMPEYTGILPAIDHYCCMYIAGYMCAKHRSDYYHESVNDIDAAVAYIGCSTDESTW